MKRYPDVSELLARKEARRRRLARLPIEEKMEIADQLRKLRSEIDRAVNAERKSNRSSNRTARTSKGKGSR